MAELDPVLKKRLDNCAAKLQGTSPLLAEAKKQHDAVMQVTAAAKKALEGVKFSPPSFSAASWSKAAQKLGATAAELTAIKNAESKGSREACAAAAKAISANKKLAPIVNAINATLRKDSEIAAQLKALQSKAAQAEALIQKAEKLIPS